MAEHPPEPPEHTERWLRSLIQHAYDVMGVLEADGTVRYVSPAVRRMLGYSPEEVIGTEVFNYVHPDDFEKTLGALAETLKTPRILPAMEFRARCANGSWRHVEVVRSNRLNDPNIAGVVINVRDITERKKAEEELRSLQQEYEELVDSVEAIIWRGDARTLQFTFVNDQVEAILGYPAKRWTEEPSFWPDRIHPDDREWALSFCKAATAEKRSHSFEYRMIAADGSVVWLRDIVHVAVEGDVPTQLFGVMVDITERKEAEEALKESEQRFRRSFEDAAIGMALVATDGQWLRVNRSLCELVGYPEKDLLNKTFQDITHPDDLDTDLGYVQRMLAGEIETYQMEKRYIHKEGHVVWILLSVSLVHDEEGVPLYFVSQMQDITERKRLEDELRHHAFHDLLTDLPNRQLFVDRLGHTLQRIKRRRGQEVAILFMDLDNFKAVNDSLGHEVGDRLLVEVVERIKNSLRREDTLARFGGDEFTILIEGLESPEEAVRVAERIGKEFSEPFLLNSRELYVRVSIGIAIGDATTKDPQNLMRDADTAMYRAKHEGAQYKVFDEAMHGWAVSRLELESDLRRALEREEFVVHYQPIVNLQSGGLWGLEALVRWHHPERGLLEPDEFVLVAEESGLVVAMDEMVLKKACRRAVEWQRKLPHTPPLAISVNLSGRQLRRPDLHEVIQQALEESGLSPSSLGLDITETVYISALDMDTNVFDRLKALGVRISLDDFGTGYSSLSYIKGLPADILKIDKSFTRGLGIDVEDTAITQTIVDLTHILGMEVVAEGVEVEEQETLLKEMGCDFAQGYYFSKPLPPEEVPRLLTGER